MASEVDICNLALAHIGDRANIASIRPPEGSAQAEHCARFYPVARDALLEMPGDWSFALRRVDLALDGNDTPGWEYSYARPANCIRIVKVLPLESTTDEDDGVDFREEGSSIYTNEEDATLWYVARVEDPTKFTPLFTMALSYLLASYLAGPVRKGDAALVQQMQAAFARHYAMAQGSNAKTKHSKPTHTTWMARR